jgi:long-chain fatty acid transport protein
MRKLAGVIAVLSLLGQANLTWATTEIPAMLDARSVGMAGTATAFVDNASAIFFNPAALQLINEPSLTLNFTPFTYKTTIPLMGPDSHFESNYSFAPLFFAGGAYRFHDRVVAGLGFLTPAGFGIDLENLPGGGGDLKVTLAMMELAVPVSVAIMKGLSLGVEWRVTYMRHSIHQFVPAGSGGLVPMDIKLSGTNFSGFAAGLLYQLLPNLRFGLNYRSKVRVASSGTTEVADTSNETTSAWATPHSLRFGTAVILLEQKLLVAADFKYQFYSSSNQEFVITTATPAGDQTTIKKLNWNNSLTMGLGGEYKLPKRVALRLGYSLTQSAVPGETAGFIGPPPGWFHGVHLGAGLALAHTDIDAGLYYMFGTEEVDTATPDNAGAGDYSLSSIVASASVTYRF